MKDHESLVEVWDLQTKKWVISIIHAMKIYEILWLRWLTAVFPSTSPSELEMVAKVIHSPGE